MRGEASHRAHKDGFLDSDAGTPLLGTALLVVFKEKQKENPPCFCWGDIPLWFVLKGHQFEEPDPKVYRSDPILRQTQMGG